PSTAHAASRIGFWAVKEQEPVVRRTACVMSVYGVPCSWSKRRSASKVEFGEDAEMIVAHVRPNNRQRGRCGVCRRRSPQYDSGAGRRWWRSLDLGTVPAVLEADAPRVQCRQHGVVVAAV